MILQNQQSQQQYSQEEVEKEKNKKTIVEILQKPPLQRSPTQLAYLLRATENINFFKEVNEKEKDDEIHKQCCQYMTHEVHPKGHPVIFINDIGDKFYIILSGSVSVHIKKEQDDMSENPEIEKVAVLPTGTSFGELSLISNKPRMATIICEEECDFLILCKRNFDRILKNKNNLNSKLTYLESLAFLQEINKGYLRDIFSRTQYKSFNKKQSVFLEGEDANAMYVVTKGTFKAMKKFYAKETHENDLSQKRLDEQTIKLFKVQEKKQEYKLMQIMTFNQNEYFGEEELVDGDKREYTIVCDSIQGELLCIKKNLFLAKVMGDHGGKKYMTEHIRRKKKHLKDKYSQVQEQVDKFWKFLREDRSILKNDLQLQKESLKRQQQVGQFSVSQSLSNFDDIYNMGKNTLNKLNKQGLFDQIFTNLIVEQKNKQNNSKQRLNIFGGQEIIQSISEFGQTSSAREPIPQNIMMILDMKQKLNQTKTLITPSTSQNNLTQFQFNQSRSLQSFDFASQNQLQTIQKLVTLMNIDGIDEEDQKQSNRNLKEQQNFFKSEVTNSYFPNHPIQNNTNFSQQSTLNTIIEGKELMQQQLKELQKKQLLAQHNQQAAQLNLCQTLSQQQQQDLLFELFQNHSCQEEETKKENSKKKNTIPNNNGKMAQTISCNEEKINLLGLDDPDIHINKYEAFKNILKLDEKKIEFRMINDEKEDFMNKIQISKKQPYINYLLEQKRKNPEKIFENLKKKAIKHLLSKTYSSREGQHIQKEIISNSKLLNENTNQTKTKSTFNGVSNLTTSQKQQSTNLDQISPQNPYPQCTSTSDDTQKKKIFINTLQFNSTRNKSQQVHTPVKNQVQRNRNTMKIKKNLFETINEINRNGQFKKGIKIQEQKKYIRNNKSQGEDFNHPITICTQAFVQQTQIQNGSEGRSQSQNNLMASVNSQKQKLQSMQTLIVSPIKEEGGMTFRNQYEEYDNKNKQLCSNSSYEPFTARSMTSPSLMYIQHENQSPINKNNKNHMIKSTSIQQEKSSLQRQAYYIGQIGVDSSSYKELSENKYIEKPYSKESFDSHQKEINFQLKYTDQNKQSSENQNIQQHKLSSDFSNST